ncbi:LPP leucine zipper domain-containing protein [Vibrio sp. RC27]
MNKVLLAAASSVIILTGCASEPAEVDTSSSLAELSNQVTQLSDQVSALSSQQSTLSSQVAASEEAANRANERIDNIAQSYTK